MSKKLEALERARDLLGPYSREAEGLAYLYNHLCQEADLQRRTETTEPIVLVAVDGDTIESCIDDRVWTDEEISKFLEYLRGQAWGRFGDNLGEYVRNYWEDYQREN